MVEHFFTADFKSAGTPSGGVSLFIGLRRINGTLTAFLGLLTDFKRKLNPLGVPPDLKSGVKKCPNLLMLCGFEIRSKGGCFPFVVVGGLQIPRF